MNSVGEDYQSVWLFRFLGQTLLIVVLCIVVGVLAYHYYHGENGYHEIASLQAQLDKQIQSNALQRQKNDRLRADIADLKSDTIAIEEHARIDLGLIKPNEIFVQVSTIAPEKNSLPESSNESNAVELLDIMVEENAKP